MKVDGQGANSRTWESALPAPGRRTLVYAHRGAMGYAPQNTMTSFSLAWEMGADGIELDAQCSRDGATVVFHDDTLDALTPGRGPVRDHDLDDLLRLDAGSHFSPKFSGERIPLLETVLRARPRGTFVNIELKTDLEYDPLWRQALRPLTGYPPFAPDGKSDRDREAARVAKLTAACVRLVAGDEPDLLPHLLVSSFDPLALSAFASEIPEVPIAFLYYHAVRYDTRSMMRGVPHAAFHPQAYETRGSTVRGAHGAGRLVNCWTVNRLTLARRLVDMGVDGLITNYPDVMLRVARDRA